MATTFGTRPEDTVADSRGNVLSGVVLKLYPTEADATAQTSMIDTVTSNAKGLFPYSDADGRDVLYVRDPAGNVWSIEAQGRLGDKQDKATLGDDVAALARFEDGGTQIVYVSATGNDSSSGKTWGSAKATITGALTALAGNPGVIQLGVGGISTSDTHTLPSGTVIRGSGRRTGASQITYTGTGTLFQGTSGTRTYDQVIQDVVIIGPGKTSTAVAFDFVDMSQATLRNFTINSFGTAVKHGSAVAGGAVYNTFENGFVTACGTGVRYDQVGSNGSRWDKVKFGSCTIAVDIMDSNQNNFHACQFEVNTTAIRIDSTGAGSSDHNSFDHCRFESNTTAVNIASANVRDTEFTWPAIFGTWTVTDSGTRTRFLSSTSMAPFITQRQVLARSGSYPLGVSDDIVTINAAGSTATLPAASSVAIGRQYTIKNLNASALTVATAGGNIDGAATASLAQYAVGRYVNNGSIWMTV